jgi:anti-sigma-K factor RskA
MELMNEERMRELERRSRAAFDESVESLDASTRSRLARARAGALGELRARRLNWRSAWVPAGIAATAALASVVLLVEDDASRPAVAPSVVALEDLDIVAGGEDLAMFDEDAEFYAWAAGELDDGVG